MNLLAHPDLLDRLAASYALGTLRGGARRRFETLVRQSPALRAKVLTWQEHFAAMTELQPAVQPSPEVWKRIANQLHPVAVAAMEPGLMERLRRRLVLWRVATGGAVLAGVAAGFVGLQLAQELQQQGVQLADASQARAQLAQQAANLEGQLRARADIRYVSVLEDERQQASFLLTFDPARNTLTLKRVAQVEEGPDRSLQLWALPPGGAPRSLGVLEPGQVVRLNAGEQQLREVPALAISLEPKGGAPAGSGPTGPVLFKGALLQTAV
jgi:anti-sigma-K factor RskA